MMGHDLGFIVYKLVPVTNYMRTGIICRKFFGDMRGIVLQSKLLIWYFSKSYFYEKSPFLSFPCHSSDSLLRLRDEHDEEHAVFRGRVFWHERRARGPRQPLADPLLQRPRALRSLAAR